MLKKFKELKAKEAKIARLQNELKALESDKELKVDLKLRDEIAALLKKYGRPASHLAALFDLRTDRRGSGVPRPGRSRPKAAAGSKGRQRRPRRLKVYTHPVSGEVIRTRGANHKILKAWKAEHGAATVESWAVFEA